MGRRVAWFAVILEGMFAVVVMVTMHSVALLVPFQVV